MPLRISPNISAAEGTGQDELAAGNMDAAARKGMADQLTDELVQRLSRDDGIWVDEPRWVHRLKPARQ